MKFLTFNQKLQLLILTAHLTAIYAIFWHFSWVGLLVGYIGWFLFKMIGTEIGAHRYFTHKSYKTTKLWERVLLFLHFFAGDGSMLAFIGVHRTHHHHCETERDPHSPRYMNWADITYWLKPVNLELRYWKDWVRDPVIKFTHYNYFLIHFSILGLFVLFDGVEYYGYAIGLPMILCLYTNTVINYVCHKPSFGYKNFDTKEDAINNRFVMWSMYGCGLHNNHHADPSNYRNNFKENEYDFLGWIIEKFVKV